MTSLQVYHMTGVTTFVPVQTLTHQGAQDPVALTTIDGTAILIIITAVTINVFEWEADELV